MTAMIRNLGKMSSIGLLKPLSPQAALVCNRLRDTSLLSKVDIHTHQSQKKPVCYNQLGQSAL